MAGLESSTYISGLNPLNPDGTADYVSSGDDHIRLIKSCILNTFTNITGPVTASQAGLTNSTYLADTSVTANVITLAFSPVITAYTAGIGVIFKCNNTNTGAVTVNINGVGSVSVVGPAGETLTGGELIVGQVYRMTYNGTYFNLSSNSAYSKNPNTVIAAATNATIKNSGTGTLTLGTNANSNLTLNSDGSATFSGALTITGIASAAGTTLPFPSGTRLPFAQASAPTGWTQDTTQNNKMMRVVSTVGGTTGSGGTGGYGYGGSSDPTLMNVVPAHTHAVSATTSTESATHTHTDSGHAHNFAGAYANSMGSGNAWPGADTNATGTTYTGYANLSTESATHTHSFSTTSDNGSSSTNWTPMYLNFIICTKN